MELEIKDEAGDIFRLPSLQVISQAKLWGCNIHKGITEMTENNTICRPRLLLWKSANLSDMTYRTVVLLVDK